MGKTELLKLLALREEICYGGKLYMRWRDGELHTAAVLKEKMEDMWGILKSRKRGEGDQLVRCCMMHDE